MMKNEKEIEILRDANIRALEMLLLNSNGTTFIQFPIAMLRNSIKLLDYILEDEDNDNN